MRLFTRFLPLSLIIVIIGSLLTGCATASVAFPTDTPTFTITRTATSTQTQTPTASPTLPPTHTPTVTPTIVPPAPETDQIMIGKHYSYFPGTQDHDQATVEYVDLSEYRDKILSVTTDTTGFPIRIGLYRGKVDLGKWWGG